MSALLPRLRRAFSRLVLRAFACALAVGPAGAQTSAPDADETDPPLMLDPIEVSGDDPDDADYDPTGLDGARAFLTEPPFANELLLDPAFEEMPLQELEGEMLNVASLRSDAAEIAVGSESVQLRGFPTPTRRNGFTQAGIPEVLNPAGSTLVIGSLVPVIGRAAPGGIRDFAVARPRGRVTRQLDASLGTNGTWRSGARATGTVVPKKSWYLASASVSGFDGPQDFAEGRQTSVGAALAVRHSRATSTLWTLDALDYRGNPAPGIPHYRRVPGGRIVGPYLPLAHFHTDGPNGQVRRQAVSLGFQLERQLSPDLGLSSATQIFGRDALRDRFTTGQYIESTGVFSGRRQPTRLEEAHQGIAHQTDLNRRFRALGADHRLLVSLELSSAANQTETRGLRASDLATLLPPSVRTFDPDSPNYYRPPFSPEIYRRVITDNEHRVDSAAAVLSLRSALNRGRTVFTVGARHDQTRVRVHDHRVPPDAPANLVARASKDLGETSVHAGVNQRLGRRVLVFATASSAVQPSTRVDSRTGQIQDNASTSGADVGFRAQFFERRLSLGAIAYAYTNSDIVRRNPLYNDPVADPNQTQPQLVASGEEDFRGLTTQLGWKPTPDWTFTARLAWIDATTVASPDLPEEEGRRLTHLPSFAAACGLRRAFRSGPLRGFSLGGNLVHLGSTVQSYSRPDREPLEYPAYTVLNLNAGYTWKNGRLNHSVSATVGNALDTDLLAKVARVGAERSLTVGWRVAF